MSSDWESSSSAGAASDSTAISILGNPLTVYVGPRGQCQSSYVVDGKASNNYYPGFSRVGDCGFFLAFPKAAGQPAPLQGKTFGFEGNAGPGAAAGPGVSAIYTPVKQSAVSGDGSLATPYTQTTEFEVVDSSLKKDALIAETTTYVNGSPQFTSTYGVKNTSGSTIHFRAIYAGNLLVNGDDRGAGLFLGGPPRFIGDQSADSGIVAGFQEAVAPALQWTSFQQAYWSDPGSIPGLGLGDNGIWHDLETSVEEPHAFNGSIEPSEVNSGAGVEWDQLRTTGLAAGKEQAFTIVNRAQIPSALQVSPANQTLKQGQTATVIVRALDTAGQPYAGRPLVYTVGGANPKSGSVTTDASGAARISYQGTKAGQDVEQVFLDLARTGSKTPQDPAAASQITWLAPPPAPNSGYKVRSIRVSSDGTTTIVIVPAQDGTALVEASVSTAAISRKTAHATKKKCTGKQVGIRGKCLPKSTLLGRLAAKGTAGVSLKLTVKPSRKVQKALKRGKKVQLAAKLTYRSSLGGKPTVRSFQMTIPKDRSRQRH